MLKLEEGVVDCVFNCLMLVKFFVVVGLMFGFGFVLILMYWVICQIIGINNLVQCDVSECEVKNLQVDYSCMVLVEFDVNVCGLFGFKLEYNSFDVYLGELMMIVYDVMNGQGWLVVVQVILSYVLKQVMEFFKKIECFCFMQQMLIVNELCKMLVVFVIDLKLLKDVKMIMLLYMFFELNILVMLVLVQCSMVVVQGVVKLDV